MGPCHLGTEQSDLPQLFRQVEPQGLGQPAAASNLPLLPRVQLPLSPCLLKKPIGLLRCTPVPGTAALAVTGQLGGGCSLPAPGTLDRPPQGPLAAPSLGSAHHPLPLLALVLRKWGEQALPGTPEGAHPLPGVALSRQPQPSPISGLVGLTSAPLRCSCWPAQALPSGSFCLLRSGQRPQSPPHTELSPLPWVPGRPEPGLPREDAESWCPGCASPYSLCPVASARWPL